jgi:hypothetical protein
VVFRSFRNLFADPTRKQSSGIRKILHFEAKGACSFRTHHLPHLKQEKERKRCVNTFRELLVDRMPDRSRLPSVATNKNAAASDSAGQKPHCSLSRRSTFTGGTRFQRGGGGGRR